MSTYMATRKTGPTLAALNAQIAKLQAQAEALRSKEVGAVIADMRETIARYNLTAADLGLGAARPKAQKTAAPKAARNANGSKGTRGKARGKKGARRIKFTDGQGRGWSGIGKRPNWFKDALAAGKKPEDLLAKPDA
jgi:DNA-binding protein H-NS